MDTPTTHPLTIAEAADMAGVSVPTIVRARAAGRLPTLMTAADIAAWLPTRRRGRSAGTAAERRCPVCGGIFRVLDDDGKPLPREERGWDLVKARRYAGGYRWRDRCRACHTLQRMHLAAESKRRSESEAEADGADRKDA